MASSPLRQGEILVELGGFTRFRDNDRNQRFVALPDDLTPAEKAMAKTLAGTLLVPGAGLGLPAAGACRERWIGEAPAGALERTVEYTTREGKKNGPFWRAWLELEKSGDLGDPVPNALETQAAGFDRWHAIVQFGAYTYGGPFRRLTDDILEVELAKLPSDRAFLDRIGQVADDLASRFAAAAREGAPMTSTLMLGGMLLLPLVRAKRPIEPRWDALVYVADEPPAREVLAALPANRREALLFAHTPPEGDEEPWLGLDQVIQVFDMAPSERIARRIAKHLAKPHVRNRLKDLGSLPNYLEKIDLALQKAPSLAPIFQGVR